MNTDAGILEGIGGKKKVLPRGYGRAAALGHTAISSGLPTAWWKRRAAACTSDPVAQRVGEVSAWASVALAGLYGPAMVAAIVAPVGAAKPVFLAVAEVLIIVTAIPLVGIAASLYLGAPVERRIWGLGGFGFMLLLAGTTVGVHFVQLTVAGRLPADKAAGPIFGWEWPTLLYGVDVVAWDLFFGVAAVCLALTLPGRTARWTRWSLLASGFLSLAGLVGPALDAIARRTNAMALRTIGIFGYSVVFPVAAVMLARLLGRRRGAPWGPKAATTT